MYRLTSADIIRIMQMDHPIDDSAAREWQRKGEKWDGGTGPTPFRPFDN